MNSRVFIVLLILVFVFICIILTSSLVSIILLTNKHTNETFSLVNKIPELKLTNNLLVSSIEKINFYHQNQSTNDTIFCNQQQNLKFSQRILNGKQATHDAFPWMVSLRLFKDQNLYDHFCAGVLVSKKVVITAAHCVDKKKPSEVLAVFGLYYRTDLSDSIMENTYPITKIIIHENNTENDIAILLLSRPIILRENIKPICLSNKHKYETFFGFEVNVIGWGLKAINEPSSILQQAKLTMLNNNDSRCAAHLKESTKDRLYCALQINKDQNFKDFRNISTICSGDSGGPLFVYYENKWLLLGIVSFVQTYLSNEYNEYVCDPSLPSFYTNVIYYFDWINKYIK